MNDNQIRADFTYFKNEILGELKNIDNQVKEKLSKFQSVIDFQNDNFSRYNRDTEQEIFKIQTTLKERQDEVEKLEKTNNELEKLKKKTEDYHTRIDDKLFIVMAQHKEAMEKYQKLYSENFHVNGLIGNKFQYPTLSSFLEDTHKKLNDFIRSKEKLTTEFKKLKEKADNTLLQNKMQVETLTNKINKNNNTVYKDVEAIFNKSLASNDDKYNKIFEDINTKISELNEKYNKIEEKINTNFEKYDHKFGEVDCFYSITQKFMISTDKNLLEIKERTNELEDMIQNLRKSNEKNEKNISKNDNRITFINRGIIDINKKLYEIKSIKEKIENINKLIKDEIQGAFEEYFNKEKQNTNIEENDIYSNNNGYLSDQRNIIEDNNFDKIDDHNINKVDENNKSYNNSFSTKDIKQTKQKIINNDKIDIEINNEKDKNKNKSKSTNKVNSFLNNKIVIKKAKNQKKSNINLNHILVKDKSQNKSSFRTYRPNNNEEDTQIYNIILNKNFIEKSNEIINNDCVNINITNKNLPLSEYKRNISRERSARKARFKFPKIFRKNKSSILEENTKNSLKSRNYNNLESTNQEESLKTLNNSCIKTGKIKELKIKWDKRPLSSIISSKKIITTKKEKNKICDSNIDLDEKINHLFSILNIRINKLILQMNYLINKKNIFGNKVDEEMNSFSTILKKNKGFNLVGNSNHFPFFFTKSTSSQNSKNWKY